MSNDLAETFAQPHVAIIVTHVNVPYGPVVRASHVSRIFADGSFSGLSTAQDKDAKDLLRTLFSSFSPETIGMACIELGEPLEKANALYLETLEMGEPVCPKWEDAMRGVIL